MSQKFQPVRGTKDYLAGDAAKRAKIYDIFKNLCEDFSFSLIETPIFEFSGVFTRNLGESSDIVSKEMYIFQDRGGEELALRPEITASVVRSLISNSLLQTMPQKFAYYGPAFRYERPQKGRLRQFTQAGIEFFGINSPLSDAQAIIMADYFLQKLGLQGKYQIEINSLGDKASRDHYRSKIVEYFSKYINDLSEDSKRRLENNPLRILDSKDDGDRKLFASAPKIEDSLTQASSYFRDKLFEILQRNGIEFRVNHNLVRGLDYYDETIFEFTSEHLGSQGTILAGGRYNNLVKQMGGSDIAAVGWASGVERLQEIAEIASHKPYSYAVISLCEEADLPAFDISIILQKSGFISDYEFANKVAKKFKNAADKGFSHAIIIGEDEMRNRQFALKNLSSGEQNHHAINDLLDVIASLSF